MMRALYFISRTVVFIVIFSPCSTANMVFSLYIFSGYALSLTYTFFGFLFLSLYLQLNSITMVLNVSL